MSRSPAVALRSSTLRLSFRLFRDRILVVMDDEAAARMRHDGTWDIRFTRADANLGELRSAVVRALGGECGFTDES